MEGFGKRKDDDEKRPKNEEPTDKKICCQGRMKSRVIGLKLMSLQI